MDEELDVVYRYTDYQGDEIKIYDGASGPIIMVDTVQGPQECVAVHYGKPLDDLIDALTTIRDDNRA